MKLGYILSLVILGVSLLFLVVVGFYVMKKMKPTLDNIKQTQTVVDGHVRHFTHEGEVIKKRVEDIKARLDYTKTVAEMKTKRFENFSVVAADLGDSLTFLKEHGGDYSKGIAQNTYTEIKTDGPRLAQTFKRAIKKTVEKQKKRRN